MNTQPPSGNEITRLLELWRAANTAPRAVELFGTDYDGLIGFLSTAYTLAGGREDVFDAYRRGVPATAPEDWALHAAVVTEALDLAARVAREADWKTIGVSTRLPVFAYLLASRLNNAAQSRSGNIGPLWDRCCYSGAEFLNAVLRGLHVSTAVLNAASWLGSHHAVPVDYARNVLGGTESVERAERSSQGTQQHYAFNSIAALHAAGVPWDYANAFSFATTSGEATPFSGRPSPENAIVFWQGGVPVECAAQFLTGGMDPEYAVQAYAAGLAPEYAWAAYEAL